MFRNFFCFFIAFFASAIFVFFKIPVAMAGDIVINEIGAYESSGHEWLEIWNRGSMAVDLSGWKFWEDTTNHGLTASSTDAVVEPGEYAAICQNEENFLNDHPLFAGSIFDSSWGSLNESGEEIGLKNADGELVENFTYISAPDFSLERIDPLLDVYDESNWKEHAASNTIGFLNSVFGWTASTTPVSTTTPVTPTSTPSTPTTTPSTSTDWSPLRLNEFVSNPESGNEWVEIYNPTNESLVLSGGWLCDERAGTTTYACKTVSGSIAAKSWLYLDLLTTSFLNNDSDSVVLKDSEGAVVDQIDYLDDLAAEKGQSVARRIDGLDDGENNGWALTEILTPGAANSIYIAPQTSGGGGSSLVVVVENQTEDKDEEIVVNGPSPLGPVISEILPDPDGADTNEEFIEIFNTSTQEIDLNGWTLTDSARVFNLYGKILSGQYIYWKRSLTKISLNNSTKEELRLIAPDKTVASSVSYDKAKTGQSLALDLNGEWRWTVELTPGASNIFTESEPEKDGVVLKINGPTSGRPGEMLVFDAEDSADERGGNLSFIWDFGDGGLVYGGEATHVYSTSGAFSLTITASSTAGSFGKKIFKINIADTLSQNQTGIQFSEILVNPEGVDDKEYIELYNSGEFPIDIGGWTIAATNKKFAIPFGAVIVPDSWLVFYRAATGIVLNNQENRLELLNRDGQVVDLVKIGAAKEGWGYSLINGEWQWTESLTPGKMNLVVLPKSAGAVKTASAGKVVVYKPMTIGEARGEENGVTVKVRGVVLIKPGIFSSQTFYIADQSGGIQIYNYKKDFPDLQIGDWLEVSGELSESRGQKRIKTKIAADMDILEIEHRYSPLEMDIENLEDEDVGRLLVLNGQITEMKSGYLYLDNGAAEIKVVFKKGAAIDKSVLREGDFMKITGVLEIGSTGFELWPRGQFDLEIVSSTQEVAGVKISGQEEFFTKKRILFFILGLVLAVVLGRLVAMKVWKK